MPNELRELNVPSSINMSFAEFYQLATHDLEVKQIHLEFCEIV